VSIFYHKPNSDMWQSQRGFFLAPRAPHSRRHFTERASLEVRTRDAHRRDGYRRERRRGFFLFHFFKSRTPALRWTTRSFVRSIDCSINQSAARERVSDSFFSRDDRRVCFRSFATRSRSTDANDVAKWNSFNLDPFVSAVRSSVRPSITGPRSRGSRSVDRSIGTLDRDPRRRRGAKSD
jgi:hypothetical protein